MTLPWPLTVCGFIVLNQTIPPIDVRIKNQQEVQNVFGLYY